jgi:tetratricopeptide (TPR) repeat protein
MMDQVANDTLNEYRRLFAFGRYDEAAQLVDTFLWKLYADGQVEEAKKILIDIASTAQSRVPIVSAWLNLGDILYRENLYDRARTCYMQGLEIEAVDSISKAKLLFGVANAYFMEGNYLAARDYYRQSLDISRIHHFSSGMAENQIQLSDIARTLGQYDEAESLARSSLEINVQAHRKRSTIRSVQSLCNLAIHLNAVGEIEKAKGLMEFCLSTLASYNVPTAIVLVQQTLNSFSKTDS